MDLPKIHCYSGTRERERHFLAKDQKKSTVHSVLAGPNTFISIHSRQSDLKGSDPQGEDKSAYLSRLKGTVPYGGEGAAGH